MKPPLFFFAILFMLVNSNAAQGDAKIRLSLQHCVDGSEYVFELDESKIASLPTWHPESDRPAPVGLKEATEIGRARLRARYPEIAELEIWSVSINEMVSTRRLGAWFYLLSYVGKRDGKDVPSCRFSAVVLMDGSSVEPVAALPQELNTP